MAFQVKIKNFLIIPCSVQFGVISFSMYFYFYHKSSSIIDSPDNSTNSRSYNHTSLVTHTCGWTDLFRQGIHQTIPAVCVEMRCYAFVASSYDGGA